MVKELYLEGPNAPPVGYSVMRKLRSRSGPTGDGWLFYVCTGCHRSGIDYLRSAFRP